MTPEDIKKIIAEMPKGKRINLRGADLREADLSWANLRKANLSWADLSETNLRGAALPQRFIAVPSVGNFVRNCWAWVSDEGVEITLGCRKFTCWDAARRHYNAADYSGECAGRVDMAIAALDYGERAEALVRRSLANG